MTSLGKVGARCVPESSASRHFKSTKAELPVSEDAGGFVFEIIFQKVD